MRPLRVGFLNLVLAVYLTGCSSAYVRSEPPAPPPFPEGTTCRWIMGQEGEVAYCVLPDGTRVMVPKNCWPIGENSVCRPLLEGL